MSFVPGLHKELKKAVNLGARKVENLLDLGSGFGLNKVMEVI